jgi:hypothetical protein
VYCIFCHFIILSKGNEEVSKRPRKGTEEVSKRPRRGNEEVSKRPRKGTEEVSKRPRRKTKKIRREDEFIAELNRPVNRADYRRTAHRFR